jgi:hypothetical protein
MTKLAVRTLRRLIREEISKHVLLEYEQALVRRGEETYLIDDDGNEEYYDSDPESHDLYQDGDATPYYGRQGSRGHGGYGGYGGYGGSYRRRRY